MTFQRVFGAAVILGACGAGCGGSKVEGPPPEAPSSKVEASAEKAAAPSDDKAEAAPTSGLPKDCASRGDICAMPKDFVKRLCAGGYLNVALALFSSKNPWTRGYLTRKTEAWNAEGGASAGGFLDFDEEVLLLTSKQPPKGGMVVSGAGGYQAIRWDGSCVTLANEEVTQRHPPKAKHPRLEWRYIEDSMREALRKDPKIDEAVVAVKRECKGVSSGDVSKKCVDADQRLGDLIVDFVSGGGEVATPEKMP